MDAKKAANTNIKTNSIKQPLSIWIRNNSGHCIFNCHEAQKDKPRQNIFILQNINKIKKISSIFPIIRNSGGLILHLEVNEVSSNNLKFKGAIAC